MTPVFPPLETFFSETYVNYENTHLFMQNIEEAGLQSPVIQAQQMATTALKQFCVDGANIARAQSLRHVHFIQPCYCRPNEMCMVRDERSQLS